MPIGFHAIVTLQVTDPVVLVKNFGGNWYQSNLEQNFVHFVRQRGMNETAIDTPALDGIDAEIRENLVKFSEEKQLPVKLGSARRQRRRVPPRTTPIGRRLVCHRSTFSSKRLRCSATSALAISALSSTTAAPCRRCRSNDIARGTPQFGGCRRAGRLAQNGDVSGGSEGALWSDGRHERAIHMPLNLKRSRCRPHYLDFFP